jgi:hypothetical protein
MLNWVKVENKEKELENKEEEVENKEKEVENNKIRKQYIIYYNIV